MKRQTTRARRKMMRKAGLQGTLARLAPVKKVDRYRSGPSETLVLVPIGSTAAINAIAATRALARTGLTLLRAKRAVEAVIAGDDVTLLLPTVPSRDRLIAELASAGLRASPVSGRS